MAARVRKWLSVALWVCACAAACGAEALPWLALHQEADGHWDSVRYSAEKKTDTVATSLALLAFLGAGHSEKVGEYKENVRRAVKWLKSKQDASGKVFDSTDARGLPDEAYATTIATMALCEAGAMSNVAETREAAQRAADYCAGVYPVMKSANGSDCCVDEHAELPVVGWCVMALKSAKVAGLHVNVEAFIALMAYLDSVQHKADEPLTEHEEAGEAPSIYWLNKTTATSSEHPAHRLAAVGVMCRVLMGWKAEELTRDVECFLKMGGMPQWDSKEESVDLYYWYMAEICAYQQGDEVSKQFFTGTKDALLAHACEDGDNAGSWPPVGFAGRRWGRVGQTALACFCFEFRYNTGHQQLRP